MPDKSLKPEISIVIPAYNSEKTILRSLDNLLNQDILNCEIVIVNDGSTDNTRRIILELIKKEGINNNIKLIDQENLGLGGARNTGIKNSAADHITFLDADDTLDLNVVREATEKAKKGNFDIVMFRFERIGQQVSYTKNLSMLDSIGIPGINAFFLESTTASAWARIYNRKFLINSKLVFPEKRYHEDLQFVAMAYYLAQNVSFINKIGYNWILTEGSITSSVNFKHINGIIDSLLDIKRFLINEDIVDQTMSRFIVFCCRHLNGLFYKIDTLHTEYPKATLLRYLRNRIHDLSINNYNYFLWKEHHIIHFIKNINRVADL